MARPRNPWLEVTPAAYDAASGPDGGGEPAALDLISAALLLEHLPDDTLPDRLAGWLAPGGLLLLVSRDAAADRSPTALPACRAAERPVTAADLERLTLRAGLAPLRRFALPLPSGAVWSALRARRPAGPLQLVSAESAEQFALAELLMREYIARLDFELDFQDWDAELDDLAARYGPPHGLLLLALADGAAGGCVALRRLAGDGAPDGTCELKRMYLRPAFRGLGHGKALLEAAIAGARRLGYERIRLDSLARLERANALYRARGFADIPPYRENPQPDAVYLELTLADA